MANFMNTIPVNFILTLFLCKVLFLSGGVCQSVPALYVFGDSLVDVGNNNYLTLSVIKANFPHNGIDFPTGKPTGRFSNGKNAADFLAEKVGLPTGEPYLSLVSSKNKTLRETPITGVSFASGGSGILNRSDGFFKRVISMTQQVEYYSLVYQQVVQKLGPDDARTHFTKSLFLIVIGSNDLFAYFSNNKNKSSSNDKDTPQHYIDLMASTLIQFIKMMYDMEARKFVVAGVPPIGCCPIRRKQSATKDCQVEANDWSLNYNNALKLSLQDLKSELSDINYSYFDTYGATNNIIQDPQSHGIVEIKEACCGLGNLKATIPCIPIATYCSDRTDHLFWDLVHPTEIVSSFFVDKLYNGSQEFTFPINVEQLVNL